MTIDSTQEHRERIWRALREVARPDSRFHWDFSSFIADFEGSDAATDRIQQLAAWQESDRVFITPDNSTELLRRAAIIERKTMLVTTYGLGRGFVELRPDVVPADEVSYAATLDGLDHYGSPVTLRELRGGAPLRLLATGGSAVSRNGIRFGKGHGYFDLEWGLLSEIGLTDDTSEVVDIVHDCQYVDESLSGEVHDAAVDWIVTPTRTIAVPDRTRPRGQVFWELLVGTELEHLPPVDELRAMLAGEAS
jgi:5-formyltetrahydrofolate cyclo-ligase